MVCGGTLEKMLHTAVCSYYTLA